MNGEQRECEECHETTDELYERGDMAHVCLGCLEGINEEDTMKEDQWTSLVN